MECIYSEIRPTRFWARNPIRPVEEAAYRLVISDSVCQKSHRFFIGSGNHKSAAVGYALKHANQFTLHFGAETLSGVVEHEKGIVPCFTCRLCQPKNREIARQLRSLD